MSQSTDIRQGTIIRIVDDDEDIRDALSFMLECKGWQVRTYGSARDFLLSHPRFPKHSRMSAFGHPYA